MRHTEGMRKRRYARRPTIEAAWFAGTERERMQGKFGTGVFDHGDCAVADNESRRYI